MITKIYRHPKITITVILAVTFFFAAFLPPQINNELKIFLPENHQEIIAQERIKEIYGRTDGILIAVEFKNHTIFASNNLLILQQLTDDLKALSNVDEVSSLINTEYTYGENNAGEATMVVEDLIPALPQNSNDIQELKKRVESWPLYRNSLYTKNFKKTQIMITLDSDTIAEDEALYFAVKKVIKEYTDQYPDLKFYTAGYPAATVLIGKSMRRDLAILIPMVLLVLLVSLFLSFRKAGGIILPCINVLISVIWAGGLMAILDIEMTIVSMILPILLIAVGSAYSIHLISHYYDNLHKTTETLNQSRHMSLLLKTIKSVGRPVLLAGLTTIAGFSALASSEIVTIKDLGLFTSFGVIAALAVALLFIPALLQLKHNRRQHQPVTATEPGGMTEKILLATYRKFTVKKWPVILISLIVISIAAMGISKIKVGGHMINYFKEDAAVRKADSYLNEHFAGTSTLHLLFNGMNIRYQGRLLPVYSSNVSATGKNSDPAAAFDDISFADMDNMLNQEATADRTTYYTVISNKKYFITNYNSGQGVKVNGRFYKMVSNSIKSVTFLKALDDLAICLSKQSNIGKVISFADLLKKMNSAMNSDKANFQQDYYEIPYRPSKYQKNTTKELSHIISGYLSLFEISGGSVDNFLNDSLQPTQTKMVVQIKTGNTSILKKIKTRARSFFAEHFPPGYTLEMSGWADMQLAVNELIIKGQLLSIIISLIIVYLIISIVYRSVSAGFFGILPLSLPILLNFGIMGFSRIHLDVATAMVASIAIGTGIDYAVHFMDIYRQQLKNHYDSDKAAVNTLMSAGKAIVFNAVSVAVGFAVMLFSSFYPIIHLGLLISLTMLIAGAVSLTLLPVLFTIFKPGFLYNNKKGAKK